VSAAPFIIAIDGTAASGKGTLARALAGKLGLAHMDTGALYRLIALRMIEESLPATDEAAAIGFAKALKTAFRAGDERNPKIRTDEVGQMTSRISALAPVRTEVLELQRNFANHPPELSPGNPARGAVLDGRDIGTVVCPEAPVKFFVTADTSIRAQRRHKELQSSGIPVTYEAVLADMRERDARDAGRTTAPMKPAADALILDTTAMTASQALDTALNYVRQKRSDIIS
jgi:CMP/dCMP kinase